MKVILFNGAPGSGKDTAADYITHYINNRTDGYAIRYRFAQPLKEATHALYGMPNAEFDHFEMEKDLPNEVFFGKTPRQAYIETSEKMVKPVLGKDHWGKVFVNFTESFLSLDKTFIVVSDCGFIEEIQPIKNKIGAENMWLVRLYRAGTSFKNDSRGYIEDKDIPIQEINNVNIKDLHTELERLADICLRLSS